MKNANEKIALLTLLHVKGWGRKKIWELLRCSPSAAAIVEEGKIVSEWERDWEACQQAGIELVTYRDKNYPKELLNLPDFPLLLYVKGRLPEADTPCVAIVGTRNASLYGREMGEKIAREIGQNRIPVISGLARGIDTAAHKGALQGGRTIAVIGSGLGNIYPRENNLLVEKICEQGAVISEYPFHTHPSRPLFPRRNRIISGMSRSVLLIESPGNGGSMITMKLAKEQQKNCFAIPGRIDLPSFLGNHQLIQAGRACLVTSGRDLLQLSDLFYTEKIESKSPLHLSDDEKALFDLLPNEEKSIEQLVLLTQLPIMKLNVLLTRLILKKAVKEFPGKIYRKI